MGNEQVNRPFNPVFPTRDVFWGERKIIFGERNINEDYGFFSTSYGERMTSEKGDCTIY